MTNTMPHDGMEHPYRNEGWAKDIYPMPYFPMLTASDLEKTRRWYIEALGFADVFTLRAQSGAPLMAHLRWSRWADILITPAREPLAEKPSRGITLNFMSFDPDAVAERARAAEATILEGPIDRPWNARDVTIADPDGYRLNFTGPQRGNKAAETFDEVMNRVRKNL
jgi:catechol 2,3-dioxygenase-like lactoylglutathione lyase family enzyme